MGTMILVLVFISAILLFYNLFMLVLSRRITVHNRLKNIMNQEPEPNSIDKSYTQASIIGLVQMVGRYIPYEKYLLKKKKKLNQASVLMKPEEFLGISILTGALTSLLLFLALKHVILLIFGFIIGFTLPELIIDTIKNKRRKKINSQLPEALSTISNGIRAGYSFTQAMSVAAKELQPPISDEFMKVLRENSLGKTMEEALLNMSERTEDEDIDMFVTALIIQRQVGGNLSEILDTISGTIRERVRVQGEINTLTSQGKFSAIIISILPIAIALIIAIMNPKYIQVLVTSTAGIIILISSIFMELIGILLLRKIVNIDI